MRESGWAVKIGQNHAFHGAARGMGAGAAVSLPLRARIEADRSRREGSAVRVHHDRLGVVIGQGVIEARLDDPVNNLRRILGDMYVSRDQPLERDLPVSDKDYGHTLGILSLGRFS